MKLALVTGGHRRLGAMISARLAADGWALAIHGAHDAEPDAILAAAFAKYGTAWHGFVADLADSSAVEGLIPVVTAHFGRAPDLLVNNASRFVDDTAATATAARIAAHHAVNAAAPVALALALHRSGGTGSVVNIIDQRIRNPVPDQFGYGLSKAALASATRTLAVSLAPHIRVNAVAPGLTLPTADYDAAQMARIAAAMPLGVLPSPGDIADTVAFLAGAQSMTGQTLFVDGGASLKSFDRDFVHL
ncbi:SDR family oxidoreductase [Sphingomonas sp. SUN039]|uniref:SDR family oxidoreductase n=1 Tax=Sphingomonas sp. SUN039 TaxID=2937787 RepID=UPI0021647889|nr:SDR family oxidoreductase [Sphingomonas sp. SUN039]UVO52720.1 SDR family oxidoreductase [Sphingomonas sp. SUN039]